MGCAESKNSTKETYPLGLNNFYTLTLGFVTNEDSNKFQSPIDAFEHLYKASLEE